MATDGNSKEKGDRLRRTYQAAGCITREKIARDEPLHEEALRAVEASDIVVVTGMYDRVQQVLEALDLRFTTIQPEQLGRIPLRPEQLLVINCPGQVKSRGIPVVRDFVARGGCLSYSCLRSGDQPSAKGS